MKSADGVINRQECEWCDTLKHTLWQFYTHTLTPTRPGWHFLVHTLVLLAVCRSCFFRSELLRPEAPAVLYMTLLNTATPCGFLWQKWTNRWQIVFVWVDSNFLKPDWLTAGPVSADTSCATKWLSNPQSFKCESRSSSFLQFLIIILSICAKKWGFAPDGALQTWKTSGLKVQFVE